MQELHTYTYNLRLQVRWAEQLFEKSRVKRHFIPDVDKDLLRVKRVENYNLISSEIENVKKFKVPGKPPFNDELWDHEWYLVRRIFLATFSFEFLPITRQKRLNTYIRTMLYHNKKHIKESTCACALC